MKLSSSTQWIGTAWFQSPLGWALLIFPLAFTWALSSVPSQVSDAASPRAEQISFLTSLLAAGWVVGQLHEMRWMYARQIAARRVTLEAVAILQVIFAINFVYWLGALLVDPSLDPAWPLLGTNWIHLGFLALFTHQLPLGKRGKWWLLLGLGWALPATIPAFRFIAPVPNIAEPWSSSLILQPLALLIGSYLLARTGISRIRGMDEITH
ncbi:MAG: hypothetical protein ACI8TQ_000883 [Planctomycetota bacterium]